MKRRDFLRGISSMLTLGMIAPEQVEILERVGWQRSIFPAPTPLFYVNLERHAMTLANISRPFDTAVSAHHARSRYDLVESVPIYGAYDVEHHVSERFLVDQFGSYRLSISPERSSDVGRFVVPYWDGYTARDGLIPAAPGQYVTLEMNRIVVPKPSHRALWSMMSDV